MHYIKFNFLALLFPIILSISNLVSCSEKTGVDEIYLSDSELIMSVVSISEPMKVGYSVENLDQRIEEMEKYEYAEKLQIFQALLTDLLIRSNELKRIMESLEVNSELPFQNIQTVLSQYFMLIEFSKTTLKNLFFTDGQFDENVDGSAEIRNAFVATWENFMNDSSTLIEMLQAKMENSKPVSTEDASII